MEGAWYHSGLDHHRKAAMSDTITQLHARKSVRAFTDELVSAEDELAFPFEG